MRKCLKQNTKRENRSLINSNKLILFTFNYIYKYRMQKQQKTNIIYNKKWNIYLTKEEINKKIKQTKL